MIWDFWCKGCNTGQKQQVICWSTSASHVTTFHGHFVFFTGRITATTALRICLESWWGDCTSTPKQGCVIGVTGKYFAISSGYLQGEMTTVHAVTVSEEKVCDLFARFLAFVISVPVRSIFFLKDTYSMEKTQHWPKAACMSFPCLSEFGLHILWNRFAPGINDVPLFFLILFLCECHLFKLNVVSLIHFLCSFLSPSVHISSFTVYCYCYIKHCKHLLWHYAFTWRTSMAVSHPSLDS